MIGNKHLKMDIVSDDLSNLANLNPLKQQEITFIQKLINLHFFKSNTAAKLYLEILQTCDKLRYKLLFFFLLVLGRI